MSIVPQKRRRLRLEPLHPRDRALTREVLIAAEGKAAAVVLRCSICAADLGAIRVIDGAPLFTSWWPVRDGADIHGVVALLGHHDGGLRDRPDLLVRCRDHGDAVLDRAQLLDLLRAGGSDVWLVDPRLPRHRYHRLADDWLGEAVEPARGWRRFSGPGRVARR